MIRVFLADDHRLVRAGLRLVLGEESDIEVVGDAEDGWTTLREIGRPDLHVDVLVLDVSMPRLGGLEVLARAKELEPDLGVLALSMYAAEHYTERLIAAGASGYLSKNASETELARAIRVVASGGTYREPGTVPQPEEAMRAPHQHLSAREMQVFLMIVTGKTVTDIAAELGVGQSTVSTHLARVRHKLGLSTVVDIVAYAIREGLID